MLIERQRLQDYERHSQMLNQIAVLVEEWCDDEDSTTAEAVSMMKAELLELRAYQLRMEVEHARHKRQRT